MPKGRKVPRSGYPVNYRRKNRPFRDEMGRFAKKPANGGGGRAHLMEFPTRDNNAQTLLDGASGNKNQTSASYGPTSAAGSLNSGLENHDPHAPTSEADTHYKN